MSLQSVYVYNNPSTKGWRRIHTATVLSVFLNLAVIGGVSAYSGSWTEEMIFEVNMVDKMQTDATMKQPQPKKRLSLDPRKASANPSKHAGGGSPAAAPGFHGNPLAKAGRPLAINAPKITPDSNAPSNDVPTIINTPPPTNATADGDPLGVSGATQKRGEEGTGGTGNGVGNGNGDGAGSGAGGKLMALVNRVKCQGCHNPSVGHGQGETQPEPNQIEKIFDAQRWKPGGTPHPLNLLCTINNQGYVTAASIMVSSGNADVDQSAIDLVQSTVWKPATRDGVAVECQVEFPLEVSY